MLLNFKTTGYVIPFQLIPFQIRLQNGVPCVEKFAAIPRRLLGYDYKNKGWVFIVFEYSEIGEKTVSNKRRRTHMKATKIHFCQDC